jgi:hypothetical protein
MDLLIVTNVGVARFLWGLTSPGLEAAADGARAPIEGEGTAGLVLVTGAGQARDIGVRHPGLILVGGFLAALRDVPEQVVSAREGLVTFDLGAGCMRKNSMVTGAPYELSTVYA